MRRTSWQARRINMLKIHYFLQQEHITFANFKLHYLVNHKEFDTSQIAYSANHSYQFPITNNTAKINTT